MSNTRNEDKWAEAKRRCRLSQEELEAARKMGLNPLSLIKNIPNPSERWKAPVSVWIRNMYEKRYGRPLGGRISPAPAPGGGRSRAPETLAFPPEFEDVSRCSASDDDDIFERDGYFEKDDNEPPDSREIAEQNEMMLRRQRQFRLAAERVAAALADVAEVQKVVLFGSVAVPLRKEVPRFRRFRRARVAIWHECKDVDLAVWVSSLDRLKEIQLARGRALNKLFALTEIGVAHHQVEIFLMEPGTNRYLGRLCIFGVCPKGKPDCRVAGCGSSPFLQQHADFRWRASALAPADTLTLFDRAAKLLEDDDVPF